MSKLYYIQFLKSFCALQVFMLHFFAGHGLREYNWIFLGAVPTFLLMSAWIYGLRDGGDYNVKFLRRRLKSLNVVYYPFLFVVFAAFTVINPDNWFPNLQGLIVDLLYLGGLGFGNNLPQSGHLWFMSTLLLCYIALTIVTKIQKRYAISTPPRLTFIITLTAVTLVGLVYRGGNMVYIPAYMLVFYNAKRLSAFANTNIGRITAIGILIICYVVFSLQIESLFHYGIYLRYMVACAAATATIMIASQIHNSVRSNIIVVFLADISMEIYLVHHYFVYDMPLYICAPLTIALAYILHCVSARLKNVEVKNI